MEILDYETLVMEFEESLLTKLRGHASSADYLELWVPDSDPVKSLLNMADAAQLGGKPLIVVRIQHATLDEAGIDRLRIEIGSGGALSVENKGSAWQLQIGVA